MDAYEWYLNNIFQPYSIQNNPYDVGNVRTQETPDMDVSAQIQGELANKPVYDASGRRYGSTLSDDMFDIKNGRRGNPETTNHPWVGSYTDYLDLSQAPVLESQEPEVAAAIQDYINTLTAGDIRERGGRKKFVGEGGEGVKAWDDRADFESEWASDPDYEAYLTQLADYQALKERQAILQGQGTSYNGIDDDVRYIKSGGRTMHDVGYQKPRYGAEYDESLGTEVNPGRLSPRTAEMIAKNMTQDRPEITNQYGEIGGINPVINQYRRKFGMN